MRTKYDKKEPSQATLLRQIQDKILKDNEELTARWERIRKTTAEMDKINPHRTENYQKFLAERESRIKELTDLLLSKIDSLVEQIREELNTFSPKQVLEIHKEEIDLIDLYSNELFELNKSKKSNIKHTYLSEFYYKLSCLNNEFIIYMPIKCLTSPLKDYNSFDISSLPLKQIKEIEQKIQTEDSSIFDDGTFKSYYAQYFESQIDKLNTTNEILHCLQLHPQAFPFINAKMKRELKAIGTLKAILARAPQTLRYMTQQEREDFAVNNLSAYGRIIMKNPELIDCLDKKFFSRHEIRIFFSNIPKATIKSVLGERVEGYKELEQFLAGKKNVRWEELHRL